MRGQVRTLERLAGTAQKQGDRRLGNLRRGNDGRAWDDGRACDHGGEERERLEAEDELLDQERPIGVGLVPELGDAAEHEQIRDRAGQRGQASRR